MGKERFVFLWVMVFFMCLSTRCSQGGKNQFVLENKEDFHNVQMDRETEDSPVKKEPEFAENPEVSRIVCWGDSLTFGEGGEGVTYPAVLQEYLPDTEVINYGIQGETAKQIAIRAGILPMTVSAFTIPKDGTRAEVQLWHEGEDPNMMRLGDKGINPCTIGGVEGNLSYDSGENKYYFTRINAGEETEVPEGTQVITFGDRDKSPSDVVILFAGTNKAPDKEHVQELVDLERQMLDYIGSDKYIVIGLTCKEMAPDVVEINQALQRAFGEHFLDVRSYLLKDGLKDGGMTATEQDLADIKNGEIPSQLRVDIVHGKPVFYRLVGEQVYKKLKELGYCS